MQRLQLSFQRFIKSATKAQSPSNEYRRRRRLIGETLEVRRVLTSYWVDTVADTVAQDGFVSLREALQAANTNQTVNEAMAGQSGDFLVDTIRFAPEISGATIRLSLGEFLVSDSVNIVAEDSDVTIDANGTSRGLRVMAETESVALRGLTLIGGVADLGGGLLVETQSQVTLEDVVITGNEATGDAANLGGGGIANDGGSIIILGGLLAGNNASGTSGSGGGLLSRAGDVIVDGTVIQSNLANRAGGGIEIIVGTLTLNDVMLGGRSVSQGNTAGPEGSASPGNGGGLHVTGGATPTLVTITGGEVINNFAASEGGGLWNQANTTMIVTGGTQILNNLAAGPTNTEGGGGIFNNGGLLIISDVVIRNNAALGLAGGGGGVASDGGTVTIANTFIAGNFAEGASGSGGGLLGIGNSRFNVIDSEISNNVASRAGGGIEIATLDFAGLSLSLLNVDLLGNNAGVLDEDATAASPGNGGGLHVTGTANVLLVGGVVSDNIAAREGGGLWNDRGTLTIERTQVLRNIASGDAADDGGGGVFNNGGLVVINGGNVSDNAADGVLGSGGGLFNLNGRLRVTDTVIEGNASNRAGGGVEGAGDSTTTLTNVQLINNVTGPSGLANPGNGGGLHLSATSDAYLAGGVVSGNFASSEGGGLWNNLGLLNVHGTEIRNNVAMGNDADNGGGGVFNNGGRLTLVDAMIIGNAAVGASGSGGGVFNFGGEATITNSVVSGNLANRAGGGIEVTGDSTTTLQNVSLDGNNTGVSGAFAGAGVGSTTLLQYLFDDMGNSADATGMAADANGNPMLLLVGNGGNPTELRGEPGSGVSGASDDLALDNTDSTGTVNASGAGHAADFNPIDALDAFTLSGWFRLPSTATEGIGRQDALIENGTISVLDLPGGFRLRGGNVADSGTLQLTVNRDQTVESSPVYAEIGEYVFFAVTYDGTQSTDNVRFYKGTVGSAVTLVDTLTLNAGSVLDENIPLSIGVTRTSGLTLSPFNGLLDRITIGEGVASLGQLESQRLEGYGSLDALAANPGNGGGLHISGDGLVFINEGTVSRNLAANEGGGLWVSSTGQLIVDGTVISNNVSVDGGGVYSDGGLITLLQSEVSDNVAIQSGGGIYTAPDASIVFPSLTVENTDIFGNQAMAETAGWGGGGLFVAGSAVLTNTNIFLNTAVEGMADGGGLLTTVGSDVSTTGGVIRANRAARAGGGIENQGFFNIDGTSLVDNFAGVNGGALHQSGAAFAVIAFASLANNEASNEGGGLWNSSAGLLSVLQSTFTGNLAIDGGAIFGDGTEGSVSVDDSTFSGNQADRNGGALAVEGGTLFLAGNVFTGNIARGNAPGLGGGAIHTAAANEIIENDLIDNLAEMPMGNGGGILVAEGGTGTYFGGTINGNVAGRAGGGVELIGQLTLDRDVVSDTDLLINSNFAGINGGGLHISGAGIGLLRRASVTNNVARAEGGGLWNSSLGSLTVNGIEVIGNSALGDAADQGGGGIYNDGGEVSIENVTLQGNTADGDAGSGGGLLSTGGSVEVLNSTLTFNGANRAGGGIEIVDGILRLTNTDLISNDVNGDATGGVPSPGNGGGLHVSGIADVQIIGGVVSGNSAASEGGGLWNQAGSTLTISGGTLIQVNRALGDAADNGGGGVFNNGGIVNIVDAVILSNFADGINGSGGGILNVAGGSVNVTDTLIAENVASRAGGGIEDASVATGTIAAGNAITLTRVQLLRNNAGVVIQGGRGGALFSSPGNGGGLHISGAGNVLLEQTSVVDNVAANEGGGLWNATGSMRVNQSTVSGNAASRGGGLFNDSVAGDIVLTNVTVSGNSADNGGGLFSEGGDVLLTSSTIANNMSSQGGGVTIQGGAASASSSIIAMNIAPTNTNISGLVSDLGFNVLNGNAGLLPLANNGGPTQTHALSANSSALNNGDPDGVRVDQRDVARPQGPNVDSGAFESALNGSSPLSNDSLLALDTTNDGDITALDALIVINYINQLASVAQGESTERAAQSIPDVNGDGWVTALDALLIINSLNRDSSSSLPSDDEWLSIPSNQEGESLVDQRKRQVDELLLDQLALDVLNQRG